MRRQIAIALGLGFILLAGFISPVAGENDSLHVVLVVEDRNYSVGDSMTVQLRVYNSGALANVASPDDAYLGVSTNYNFNNPTNLTLTNSGTGIYTGSYTIKAADNNHNLYFFYEVTIGNDHEETANYVTALVIPVYAIQDTVDVSFCGQDMVPAKGGDVLTATILTKTGTSPIPVTGFNQLYVEAPGGQRQNLTFTTVETGIYNAAFTVPQISVSGIYEIVAQPMGMGDQDSAMIYVNVLDVWYHRLSVTGNTVSFEVCVADMSGVPVAGANFYIRRGEWPHDEFTGVTNASGKAMVYVPDVYGQTGFGGYALAGGLNQTISGVVTNFVEEDPDNNGFDILWEGTETIFGPDEDVSIPYGAYDSQIPAASKTINYYITARGTDFAMMFGGGDHVDGAREVLAAGTLLTNNLGKFSLDFTTPEVQCAIEVRLEVPLDRADFGDQVYDLDDDMHYSVWPPNHWDTEGFVFYAYEGNLDGDGDVGIGGGGFNPGEAGTIDVSLSVNSGDPIVALWGIGEWSMDSMDRTDPEWMSWVPAGYMIRLEQTESGKYQGTFLVPEFIEDQDITVVAGYQDSADGTPHFDAKTISPGGALPWLWIIIILAIIVVVVVLAIVLKSRL